MMKKRFPLTRASFVFFKQTVWGLTTFVALLFLYVVGKGAGYVYRSRFFPKKYSGKIAGRGALFYQKAVKFLDIHRRGTISRIDLIDLSVRSMKMKKTRTAITIGGMAVGIGAIVFLVSIGYGLQHLVVSRVVRLEEMKQIEVFPQPGSKVKISDKTLADFNSFSQITSSLPLIAVVGHVSYQSSVSDMPVYGVTSDYLRQSAVKAIRGKIFENNKLVAAAGPGETGSGEVAGISTEEKVGVYGEEVRAVDFRIDPGAWIRVREGPDTKDKILGYTKRTEGMQSGREVWGGSYRSEDGLGEAAETEEGKPLGRWIKAPVLLWEKQDCGLGRGDCEDGRYLVRRDEDNSQTQEEGYFAEINMSVKGAGLYQPEVLGLATDGAGTEGTGEGTDAGWVEIASEAGVAKTPSVKKVAVASAGEKKAVVNRAMLKVLGIKEAEALGKKFSVSFVVVGSLLKNNKEKIESLPVDYLIVGVVPEDKMPFFYVPFIDLRSLGVSNYSQAKVSIGKQDDLARVRKKIEAMGYVTRSVADTVSQINSLFSTARTFLALLGLVALAVAALGMFNTLTVSLLERTREVGLMKAMGMKSSEVKELFLTESMIMGFFGGLLGILLGFALGKIAGIFLSFLAIFKGMGMIDIAYLPLSFIAVIVFLSLLVGLLTGIYPARRATKISALDALRYE